MEGMVWLSTRARGDVQQRIREDILSAAGWLAGLKSGAQRISPDDHQSSSLRALAHLLGLTSTCRPGRLLSTMFRCYTCDQLSLTDICNSSILSAMTILLGRGDAHSPDDFPIRTSYHEGSISHPGLEETSDFQCTSPMYLSHAMPRGPFACYGIRWTAKNFS